MSSWSIYLSLCPIFLHSFIFLPVHAIFSLSVWLKKTKKQFNIFVSIHATQKKIYSKHFQGFLHHLHHSYKDTYPPQSEDRRLDLRWFALWRISLTWRTDLLVLCSHVCSVLSSKCLLSSLMCRFTCEWFMCLCGGGVSGCVRLCPELRACQYLLCLLYMSWHSHGLRGLWLCVCPWSLPCNGSNSNLWMCVYFHSWRRCADESLISLNQRSRRTAPLLENISRYVKTSCI